jgi:hypothetical protein
VGPGAAIVTALSTRIGKAQTDRVNRIALLLLLVLPFAGCASGPEALGVTGPRGSSLGTTPGPLPGQDPFDSPNAFQSGTRYSPSPGPTTGSGHYWGYN